MCSFTVSLFTHCLVSVFREGHLLEGHGEVFNTSLWSNPGDCGCGRGCGCVEGGCSAPTGDSTGVGGKCHGNGQREKLRYNRDVREHLRRIAVGFESWDLLQS